MPIVDCESMIVIELTEQSLVAQSWLDRLQDPAAGALTSFVGVVRNHHEGKPVAYLEYSAYREMALVQLNEIAEEMMARWPLSGVALVHRLGRLEIGETSVLIAAAAAHRAETFEACRHGIETLKQRVPIWKKEYYDNEPARWIGESKGS